MLDAGARKLLDNDLRWVAGEGFDGHLAMFLRPVLVVDSPDARLDVMYSV